RCHLAERGPAQRCWACWLCWSPIRRRPPWPTPTSTGSFGPRSAATRPISFRTRARPRSTSPATRPSPLPTSRTTTATSTSATGSTGNTTPLARSFPAGDGSRFGNDTDYFLDFAFPVPVMIANGLIATAADLDQSVYFAATSADPNNYNKSHLNCPFLPGTDL